MMRMTSVSGRVVAIFAMGVWSGALAGAAVEPVNPYHGAREREEVYGFAAKPSVECRVSSEGKKTWTISFATTAACDATVAIVDKDGRVVRHLASGVLGANAPWPFKQGTLEQTVEWDGKDDRGVQASGVRVQDGEDGKSEAPSSLTPDTRNLKPDFPAPSFRLPFAARVALGFKADFARIVCAMEEGVAWRGPIGIATDREGNLYVSEGTLHVASVTTLLSVKVFDGDGNYLRTIMPFRADSPPEKVSRVEFLTTVDGRRIPLSGPHGHRHYTGFTPGTPGMVRHVPSLTDDGRLIFPCGELVSGKRRFLSIGADGSAPAEIYDGPPLQPEARAGAEIFTALSPDGKWLYFAGARSKREKGSAPTHVVHRVAIAPAGEAETFLGSEFAAGTATGQFNDPRGLATDPVGRIAVCDYANDRIQVFDADGKFVRALAVQGPEQVKVHPKTGAVYIISVRDRGATDHYHNQVRWEVFRQKSVVKFASLDDWRPLAEIALPERPKHMHNAGPVMALDATRTDPVLWIANVGGTQPTDFLWKIIERDGRLERVEHKVRRLDGRALTYPPMAADRRNNEVFAFQTPVGSVRINPIDGQVTPLKLQGDAGKAALKRVGAAAMGPDDLLYIRSASVGGPHPEAGKRLSMDWFIRRFDRDGRLVPFVAGDAIHTTGKHLGDYWGEQPTEFDVGPDGRMYVIGYGDQDAKTCRMDIFGADGRVQATGVVRMTRSPGGVRVDRLGRVYVADSVRPAARAFPEFYPTDPREHLSRWYGTVFRMGSNGGGIEEGNAFMAGGKGQRPHPVSFEGALWHYHGIAPMPVQGGCECTYAVFDVDDWGRVFVSDAPGYSVAVLDSAGNRIGRFGAYGNRDALGAGSAVPEPPIAFWSPERIAVLDNDAFIADTHSARLVQVRLGARAVEEVAISKD